jgi:recombinational DNA repair ATPase RecF
VRLIELEIEKVRGIQHILVRPDGKNFVIWGPNGSGKSAVVDAIDFLLTGRIQRLTGSGTGNITLRKHGPHIDHKPEETMVRAVVQLRGSQKPIELKRSMGDPNRLESSGGNREELERITELAEQGLHILSRREILRYITANANTRAQQIQQLLDISEVEETRKNLVKVQHIYERGLEVAERGVAQAKGRVNATIQESEFEETKVLDFVNQNRRLLAADAIMELSSSNLKKGVNRPTIVSQKAGLNVKVLDRDLQNLRTVAVAESGPDIAESDMRLRELIEEIRSNPDLMRTLGQLKLIRLGMTMIDETGRCPLCETAWPPGKLLEHLKKRVEAAEVAGEYHREIGGLVAKISNSVNTTIASLQKVIAAAEVAGLKEDVVTLQSWLQDLEDLSVALGSVVTSYLETGRTGAEVSSMLAPANVAELLVDIETAVKEKFPESTPEQTAWETLIRLEENLGSLEAAKMERKRTWLCAKRAFILHDRFVLARDKILGQLYDTIRERFVDLYRKLHIDDEGSFEANIEPDEAGLNFEVDFYGRGTHPPHALHSEGHQDSMGVCLYLALTERLTKGLMDLIILDDVVMSVDVGHRRQVCRLLAEAFPDGQFLITTHDKTWANQLKTEGVVPSHGSIEFYNWSVELGPQVSYQPDMWRRIHSDLERGDVGSAAQKLRRGLEEFLGHVCDALQALVTFKLNGRWELGDFLPAGMSRYRFLLKKAKSAAQAWGQKEAFEKLQELDSTVGQIYKRCGAEQWALNANVHYNNWANFSRNDFHPVVEAFQDLCGLFLCTQCGAMLHVACKGLESVSLRCNCGAVNWNLVGRPKGVAN